MRFRPESYAKRIIRSGLARICNYVENSGNCEFEKNGEAAFLQQLFKDWAQGSKAAVVFDVGANKGEYAHMLLDYGRRFGVGLTVHVFEPVAACYTLLDEAFTGVPSVHVNHFGLSNQAGQYPIYYDHEGSTLASLHKRDLGLYNLSMDQSETVKLSLGSDYVDSHRIGHIDFLKVDVEGHELEVCQGFGELFCGEFIDYVQFEYGGTNLDSHVILRDMYDFIVKRGFQIAKIMRSGVELRPYDTCLENYCYANYVAIANRLIG